MVESTGEFAGPTSAGQAGPDLPAQGRALLLRWHHVRVWHVDSARFGLQQEGCVWTCGSWKLPEGF